MSLLNFTLKHPFRMVCVGPPSVGKSYLALDIIRNRHKIIDKEIDLVLFVYAHWQEEFQEISERDPDVVFVNRKETVDRIIKGNVASLVVFDDLIVDVTSSTAGANFIVSWWVRKSSHLNCSCIALLHNLFLKQIRTLFLCCTYTIIHANNRDRSSISHISRQMFPGYKNYLNVSYLDSISRKFGYLVLDHSRDIADKYRVRNFIIANFADLKIYIPKHEKGPTMCQIVRVINEELYQDLVSSGDLIDEKVKKFYITPESVPLDTRETDKLDVANESENKNVTHDVIDHTQKVDNNVEDNNLNSVEAEPIPDMDIEEFTPDSCAVPWADFEETFELIID
jgi:hypothetical protein